MAAFTTDDKIYNKMVEKEEFQIINLENHTIQIFQWPEWKSNLIVICSTMSVLISLCGKGMIVYYIKTYAPKGRPINEMFLIDQVYHKFQLYLDVSPRPTFFIHILLYLAKYNLTII